MKKNPVFPKNSDGTHFQTISGMGLRDYFAGQVLTSLSRKEVVLDTATIVDECYQVADAMLKKRHDDHRAEIELDWYLKVQEYKSLKSLPLVIEIDASILKEAMGDKFNKKEWIEINLEKARERMESFMETLTLKEKEKLFHETG